MMPSHVRGAASALDHARGWQPPSRVWPSPFRGRPPRGGPRLRPRRDSHPVARAGFLAPTLIIVGVFVLVPMLLTFWLSLHQGGISTPVSAWRWVGLKN